MPDVIATPCPAWVDDRRAQLDRDQSRLLAQLERESLVPVTPAAVAVIDYFERTSPLTDREEPPVPTIRIRRSPISRRTIAGLNLSADAFATVDIVLPRSTSRAWIQREYRKLRGHDIPEARARGIVLNLLQASLDADSFAGLVAA